MANEESEHIIQLGIVSAKLNSLFQEPNWNKWDGGRIGGNVMWLSQENSRPSDSDLTCSFCDSSLTFLLQIYCPLDEPGNAFHRCLYLFICRKPACVVRGSVKCYRSQLPRQNSYYAYDPTSAIHSNKVIDKDPHYCAVCRYADRHLPLI